MLPWVANPFQGGVCTGEICGALSGAAIAMGLMAYKVLPHDDHNRRLAAMAVLPYVRELTQGFAQRFGSARCATITGKDKRTPEENARFSKLRQWEQTCGAFVEYVVRAMVARGETGRLPA